MTLVTAHFVTCGDELIVGGSLLLPCSVIKLVSWINGWNKDGCIAMYERLTCNDESATVQLIKNLMKMNIKSIVSAHGGIAVGETKEVLMRCWGHLFAKMK